MQENHGKNLFFKMAYSVRKARIMTKNERLRLINKNHEMSKTEVPNCLVIPRLPFAVEKEKGKIRLVYYEEQEGKKELKGEKGKRYLKKEVARALECLFMRAEEEGIVLAVVSGYRSYERQEELYERSVKKNGISYANRYQAKAGYSEHQTGLAVDVSGETIQYGLEEIFGLTKEGVWLRRNCWKEGFIIRYPKGKEIITGYQYEPWHLRYVGRNEAEIMMKCGLTLEEFLLSMRVR